MYIPTPEAERTKQTSDIVHPPPSLPANIFLRQTCQGLGGDFFSLPNDLSKSLLSPNAFTRWRIPPS